MAVHYTTIGPVHGTLHIGDEEIAAQIVAFGWDDEAPTEVTGFWYFSAHARSGLVFISKDHVTSIGLD
jgi:hypothetical protein